LCVLGRTVLVLLMRKSLLPLLPDKHTRKSNVAHHHRLESHQSIECLVSGVAERSVWGNGNLQYLKQSVERLKGAMPFRRGIGSSCLIATIHAVFESQYVDRQDIRGYGGSDWDGQRCLLANCKQDELIGVRVVFLRRESSKGGIDYLFNVLFIDKATLSKAVVSWVAWWSCIRTLPLACILFRSRAGTCLVYPLGGNEMRFPVVVFRNWRPDVLKNQLHCSLVEARPSSPATFFNPSDSKPRQSS